MGEQLVFGVVEMMHHSMKGCMKEHSLENRVRGMMALGDALEVEEALEVG